MSSAASKRRPGRGAAPLLLGLPSWLYLTAFFVVPLVAMLSMSLATGNPLTGYVFSWNFAAFGKAIGMYHTQLIRSFWYGALSTFLALLFTYPVAYWIAFYGGRHKGSFLFIILLPFFVSFVIRTLAWQFLLSDQGMVLGTLKSIGILPKGFYVLSTSTAVVGGLFYNSIAYYVLPLYVALERIDRRVVLAANDLYASPASAFWRVVLPLSAPGIFAGFLLVFVTNVGDFVNAAVLGGTGTRMVGNIIQYNFFDSQNYPMAAALSSILMLLLIVAIYLYARVFGAEAIQDYAA